MASPETTRIGVIEPIMRRIPEGWFWMGCEDGRDDEKPRHRVWVDAFGLAIYQTTNEEYSRFLEATRRPKPLSWNESGIQPSETASGGSVLARCGGVL